MASGQRSTSVMNSLKCSEEYIDALLDKLDQTEITPTNVRAERRYPLRLRNCMVSIRQPGSGAPSTFLVPVRNISTMGIAFLHRGYVHADSICTIELEGEGGRTQSLSGTVVHCQYLESMIHLVGVRFKERASFAAFNHLLGPISVAVYLEDPELVDRVTSTLDASRFDITAVTAREDLFQLLGSSSIDVLASCAFDIDTDAITRVRGFGFKRPIVALGAVSAEETELFSDVVEDVESGELGQVLTRLVRG